MKVISFVNYKGGVGKTTLLINIAAQLACEKERVAIIDLDPQSSLTFSLIKPEEWDQKYRENKTIKNWFDDKLSDRNSNLEELMIDDLPINSEEKIGRKISLVSSNLELFDISFELVSRFKGAFKRIYAKSKLDTLYLLRNEINKLDGKFDYIFIDCQPNFDLLTQNAIIASDYYVIPTKLDYLSTLGIDTLTKHIEKLLNDLEFLIEKYKFKGYCAKPKLLGVIGNMVTIKKENQLIDSNYNRYKELDEKSYRLFRNFLRNNVGMMDMGDLIPAVLKKPSSPTQKAIIEELNNITEEFKERIEEND